jgi:hypothetical protein
MNYEDLGFSKLLTKSTYSPNSNEMTESEASQAISSISGSNISGGATLSPDKKLEVDWDSAAINVSDGAQKRAQLGNLDKTDKFGVRIRDKKGNIRFEVSDDTQKLAMYDTSYNKAIQIDESGLHGYNISGNELIEVDDTGFHAYDTLGNEIYRINGSGLFGFGTFANVISLKKTPGSADVFGTIGYLDSGGLDYLLIQSGTNCGVYEESDTYLLLVSGTEGTLINSAGSVTINADGTDVVINAADDVNIYADGDDINLSAHDDVHVFCNDFTINGVSKAAIVPTTKGYKALYCSESPEVWFFDFCYGKKTSRKWYTPWIRDWFIKPDPLFLEVTEGQIIIMPTGMKNTVQIWRRRKGLANKRFEDKTEKEFQENNKFWSTPEREAEQVIL